MKTGVIALVLSAVAFGIAVYALANQPAPAPVRADRGGADSRVLALEAQVDKLTREVESLRLATPDHEEPDSMRTPAEREAAGKEGDPSTPAGTDGDLTAIVADAVDKKTKKVLDEMRIKANKKPKMSVFASMLELTEEQRIEAERVIVEGQRKVHEVLNIPTSDGTNLMDGLVEIMARGIAQPGKDHGWGKWIARAVGEKVPGMEVTYAAYIEDIKGGMRSKFKRDWTKAQYQEFEQWGVDPTEIDKVPGSPNEALGVRIVERARALGAEVPEEEK